jgi:hypothetical protein
VVSITDLRTRSGGCCWSFGGGCLSCGGEVGDDKGVVAAGGDAVVVEMADVLDGPVAGKPDGVEPPISA